jgi:perosamine synthetase
VDFIPVAAPAFAGNEVKYVMDCLESVWISSKGRYIEEFENKFAQYIGSKHAITVSNGTVALHLSLLAYDIRSGDEIIVPTLTYIATVNAVSYCGATPVFIDSEMATWNIDAAAIEAKITARTKGIIVTHLYGHPVDMDQVMKIARKYNLFVIEDAAEAHGAQYNGNKVGSIGDIGVFSLYGNKVITTGEGGIITTNNDQAAKKINLLKSQGMDTKKRFWHTCIGYNYRMTNIQAAIGLGQLEQIDWHIERRLQVAAFYEQYFAGNEKIILPPRQPWAKNIYWLYTILLPPELAVFRDEVMKDLADANIETRPVFYPIHLLPPYSRLAEGQSYPVAELIARSGINLPTHANISEREVEYVCNCLIRAVERL